MPGNRETTDAGTTSATKSGQKFFGRANACCGYCSTFIASDTALSTFSHDAFGSMGSTTDSAVRYTGC
jgi:hypothetical protein